MGASHREPGGAPPGAEPRLLVPLVVAAEHGDVAKRAAHDEVVEPRALRVAGVVPVPGRSGCLGWKNVPVIIGGGDNPYGLEQQYGGAANNPNKYAYQQYKMRTWWDEGYKPPTTGGIGPGLWLSYGDNPPATAKFNLGLAAQHICQWWWQRRAIGDTGGAYDMVLFIRNDLSTVVKP